MGDLMFALAEWLRTTPLVELAFWISATPLSLMIQTNFWFIPTLQTIHILAIAASFGSVFMINLRILGLSAPDQTMTQTAARYIPWMWWGLAALLVTGLGMIIGEPIRELINPAFWMKMILVIVAVGVSLWFQYSLRKNVAAWEQTHTGRVWIRAGAVAVLVLWATIAVLGRWIAYAPV